MEGGNDDDEEQEGRRLSGCTVHWLRLLGFGS